MKFARIPVPDAQRAFRLLKSFEGGTIPGRRNFAVGDSFDIIVGRALQPVAPGQVYIDGLIPESTSDETPTGDELEEAKVWFRNVGWRMKNGDHAYVIYRGEYTHEGATRPLYNIFFPFPKEAEVIKEAKCLNNKLEFKTTKLIIPGYLDTDDEPDDGESGSSGSGSSAMSGPDIASSDDSFSGDSFGGEV